MRTTLILALFVGTRLRAEREDRYDDFGEGGCGFGMGAARAYRRLRESSLRV